MTEKQYIPSELELKVLNKVCLDIDSSKKYVEIPKEKQYIRARTELIETKCKGCGKKIVKNSDNQIVYFCGRECRNWFKRKTVFAFVKDGI
jgi:hypothetical protein